MSIDLSALSPVMTTATALSNLILVSPQEDKGIQPQTLASESVSPPKFLFNFYGENRVSLKSDITDHYVEDNTALQDQIALAPERVKGQGFIAELTDITPAELLPLKVAADKLRVVSAYVPELSITAQLAYNNALQAYQVAKLVGASAVSAWNSITGAVKDNEPVVIGNAIFSHRTVQTKQQVAFQQFYGYWKQRRLFTVQTPWAIFQNMAIESLDAIQDADTRMITDFEITFKPIQFAKATFVGIQEIAQGRLAQQKQEGRPVDLGETSGTPFAKSQNEFIAERFGL